MLFDDGEWEEFDRSLASTDPLEFVDQRSYKERLAAMKKATSLEDAVISAVGLLKGRKVHICSLELKFIGGSMGAVVGEKITRAIERCVDRAHAAHHRFGLRRRAHAGRRGQPDADGQDLGRPDAAGRGPHPLHQRADRPDHRRRHGQLRHAGRPQHRRTAAR